MGAQSITIAGVCVGAAPGMMRAMERADRISRVKVVEGVVTPAIIHNYHHFFVDLAVYADGLVNCWELLDLALFRGKLASGWVTTAVSIRGLGSYEVADGAWDLDADGLYARVAGLVRELNPRMENLHDCHGRTSEAVGKVNVSILGSPPGRPLRRVGDGLFPRIIKGEHCSVFVRVGDLHYLADLRAFADGALELGRLPEPEALADVAALRRAVEEGRVVGRLPVGARVCIHRFGSFTAAKEGYSTDIADIVAQVDDLIDRANDRPDSVGRGRAAHAAYEADPGERTREALRAAYEAIPRHLRMYIGDMDSKDGDVRRILCGEDGGYADDEDEDG
jgi:hypothetical protein